MAVEHPVYMSDDINVTKAFHPEHLLTVAYENMLLHGPFSHTVIHTILFATSGAGLGRRKSWACIAGRRSWKNRPWDLEWS